MDGQALALAAWAPTPRNPSEPGPPAWSCQHGPPPEGLSQGPTPVPRVASSSCLVPCLICLPALASAPRSARQLEPRPGSRPSSPVSGQTQDLQLRVASPSLNAPQRLRPVPAASAGPSPRCSSKEPPEQGSLCFIAWAVGPEGGGQGCPRGCPRRRGPGSPARG